MELNILMITLDYPPYTYGGIATHVYNLCKQFSGYNCYIKLFVARLGRYVEQKFEVSQSDNIEVIYLDSKILNYGQVIDYAYDYDELACSYFNLVLFNEIVKNLDQDTRLYDILHIHHGAKFANVYSALKRKYQLKTIMTMHAMNSDHREYIYGLRAWELENSDAVIAVSDYIKNEIETTHLYYPKYIKTIYNGIEQKYYNKTKIYDLSFCGRLQKVKGCECLCRALKILYDNPQMTELRTVIIGDGNYREYLEKGLRQYKNIVFLGNLEHEEALSVLAQSKINLVPSLIEAFGIVALESMQAGCITIASNQGGLAELIRDGYNGFLFEADCAEALAVRIEDCFGNYESLDYMIKNGKETIKEYDWKIVAGKTYEVYEHVMKA